MRKAFASVLSPRIPETASAETLSASEARTKAHRLAKSGALSAQGGADASVRTA